MEAERTPGAPARQAVPRGEGEMRSSGATVGRLPLARVAVALANALDFYQAERDGAHFVPSALRTAPAHLHDRNAMTYRTPKTDSDGVFRGDLKPLGVRMNASGGWWDAGDYPKFVVTTSYTV